MAATENTERHQGAARVVEWMLRDGRHLTHMREFGDEMCRRIVDAGIALSRAFCSVGTLHPQVAASAYVWRRSAQGAMRLVADHDFSKSAAFTASPIAAVQSSARTIRRRICDPDCPVDFPVISEMRTEGTTDYIAMPMVCSSGLVNSITWQTDQAGGFTEAEVAGLSTIADALALIVELQSTRRIARNLLDAYVGHRAGERVLSGAITRGSREEIRAVIWFADLRGFTALADNLDRAALMALLDDYFQIMVEAVAAEGGETLKLVGDAILAIFELRGSEDPSERCAAALRASRLAITQIASRNEARIAAGQPEIRCGLALHLGDVSYGNIGAPNRLDFTVIGPAVNHASRLEKLASELGRDVVTSASFARAAREPLDSLGVRQLRGIAEPQEIFAPRR